MIELLTDAPKKQPDFRLISGAEYMVSAGAIYRFPSGMMSVTRRASLASLVSLSQ